MQLLNDSLITTTYISPRTSKNCEMKYTLTFDDDNLSEVWYRAINSDGEYRDIEQSIKDDKRCFHVQLSQKSLFPNVQSVMMDLSDVGKDYLYLILNPYKLRQYIKHIIHQLQAIQVGKGH